MDTHGNVQTDKTCRGRKNCKDIGEPKRIFGFIFSSTVCSIIFALPAVETPCKIMAPTFGQLLLRCSWLPKRKIPCDVAASSFVNSARRSFILLIGQGHFFPFLLIDSLLQKDNFLVNEGKRICCKEF